MIVRRPYKLLIWTKRVCGSRRLSLGILIVFSIYLMTAMYYSKTKKTKKILNLNDTHRLIQDRLKEYVLEQKGTGCNRPDLDPFSAEVMKYSEDLPKVTCTGIDWVNCNKSECYVVEKILKSMRDVSCIYKDILYVSDETYFVSDTTEVRGSEKYTLKRSDHVKVSCMGTEPNSILATRWYGFKAGFRPVEIKPVPPNRQDSYNVMILAFDSTSLNGFIRKMPKSYKYLSERAVILNNYNIIGDGTLPALFGLLTGKAVDELPDARKLFTKSVYVDEKIFIFHDLKKYGYRTAYFEDSPSIGTFQYTLNGFLHQPADHYLRAFYLEIYKKKQELLSFMDYHVSKFCVGAVPQCQLMMNLADEFLQLDGKKFCFTMISDISHNNFNMITTADEPLISFLDKLYSRRTLEDTLVLIMGDHGFRFGPMRETYQGKVEERLPLMAILLPEKLKHLRPNALKALNQNRDVLTTVFDVHSTILDVLDLKDKSNKYTVPGSDLPRAMSLLEPIPKTRSCSEAGIIQHWCTCTKWFNVSQSGLMYNAVANVLAEYINKITDEQRSKCERRKLISIESVLQQNVNNHVLKYGYDNDMDAFLGNPKNVAPRAPKEYYQAKIILSPGRAVFEGTMVYSTHADAFTISQKDISRISAYRNESKCISATHPHLHKYCYCK